MFILCPHCQFLVAVDPISGLPPEHCPRCHEALQPLIGSDSSPPIDAPVLPSVEPELPSQADESDLAIEEGSNPVAPPQAPTPDVAPSDPQAPVFADLPEKSAIASPHHRWRIPFASAGLTCLLLLQMLLADWVPLAADARWRPMLSMLCNTLRCSLPPWHDPDAFTLLQRDVRPDPQHTGVLHVTAGIRNDARWAQRWPLLLLTLSDADGRVVGTRLFTPRDYLASGTTQKTLGSGQGVRIAIDILEPTPQVVAFTFDFR
jgi:hypothetical protein